MQKKVLLSIVVLLLALLVPAFAVAQTAPVDATFAWEQPDYENVNYWILYWGDQPGGPYTVGEVRIDKTQVGENQSAPVTIPYPDGAKTTYYFVLVAFQDVDHYSDNSNEVPLEIDFIPLPGTPVNLRVTITPTQ